MDDDNEEDSEVVVLDVGLCGEGFRLQHQDVVTSVAESGKG